MCFNCNRVCSGFYSFLHRINNSRRISPLLFEVSLVLGTICVLLIADLIWIGHRHHKKFAELEYLHELDLTSFRKQFDLQMHQIEQQRKQIGGELKSKHEQEVAIISDSHQKELESKISSIQSELNHLLSLSKGYWEKHAKGHHVEIQLGPENQRVDKKSSEDIEN